MNGLVILTQHEVLTDLSKYIMWPGLAVAFCVISIVIVFSIIDAKIYWQFYALFVISVIMIIIAVILPRETVIMAYAPDQAAIEAAMDQYHVREIDGKLLTMYED